MKCEVQHLNKEEILSYIEYNLKVAVSVKMVITETAIEAIALR